MKVNICLTCLTVVLMNNLFSQDTLSLSKAIATGLENNYQIKIAHKEKAVAVNNNSWGMAGSLPVITAGVNQMNQFNEDTVSSSFGNISPYVNMRWTLFNGFSAYITKQKLGHLEELSDGNTAILVENTIQGIILAYYFALLQKEQLEVVKEVMDLSSDRYRYMIYRKELGSAVTFDVLQAQNNYLSDSSNFILQQNVYNNSVRNLNLILAQPVNQSYYLSTPFDITGKDFLLSELITLMKANNKTLINQYVNQAILKKEVKIQQSSLYPTIALNTGYDYVNSWSTVDPFPKRTFDSYDYYLNFTLGITLFNGNRVRKGIQNARIQEKIGQLRIEEMHHELHNRLSSVYEMYNVRKQLKQVAELSVESAALNLQISEEKYKSGAINSFNYRDIQLIYLNAAIARLQAIYNLLESETDILRLTGTIINEY